MSLCKTYEAGLRDYDTGKCFLCNADRERPFYTRPLKKNAWVKFAYADSIPMIGAKDTYRRPLCSDCLDDVMRRFNGPLDYAEVMALPRVERRRRINRLKG